MPDLSFISFPLYINLVGKGIGVYAMCSVQAPAGASSLLVHCPCFVFLSSSSILEAFVAFSVEQLSALRADLINIKSKLSQHTRLRSQCIPGRRCLGHK